MLYVGMLRFYLSAAGCSINILHVILRLSWNVEVLFICSRLQYQQTICYVEVMLECGGLINLQQVIVALCYMLACWDYFFFVTGCSIRVLHVGNVEVICLTLYVMCMNFSKLSRFETEILFCLYNTSDRTDL